MNWCQQIIGIRFQKPARNQKKDINQNLKKNIKKTLPKKKNIGVKSWNAQLEALFVESKAQLWQLLCDLRLQFGDLQATWKFTSENLRKFPKSTKTRRSTQRGSLFSYIPWESKGVALGWSNLRFPMIHDLEKSSYFTNPRFPGKSREFPLSKPNHLGFFWSCFRSL